jgi:DNA polymerase I-like protein with 3'-5' exonuclease and polymerase domains
VKPPECIVVDFETHGIQARPDYPPKPVSVGIQWPGTSKKLLMGWGHEAGGNNCTEKEARGELRRAYDSKYPLLFQNMSFDLDVAETHWELPVPEWQRTHDTMFLLFYTNPHAETLSLKPSAHAILGIAPDEQDRMYDWIVANVPEAKRKPSIAGAYIWRCPFTIVKPYLAGDLLRTLKLFNHLYQRVVDSGQLSAYERDRRLMPVLLRNAREGMRVDTARLEQDLPLMQSGVDAASAWLKKRLKQPDMNVDSDQQLGRALYDAGVVSDFKKTPKGHLSVSKKHLTIDRFKDKKVYQALTYRTQMSTSIDMFMSPWLELANKDGRLHGNWSQVRSPKGDSNDTKGARSGRIICSRPNLLNIPKKWKRSISAGYVHPGWLGKNVPELPFMRTYVLPDKNQIWGRRDYNQQELRLFGEYEEGEVMQGFLSDPRYDIHESVRAEAETSLIEAALREEFDRDSAKTTVFGALYGQGLNGLMQSLNIPEEERHVAQLIQKALNRAVPSIKELSSVLKAIGDQDLPIKTWGDRLYYKEPSKYVEKFGRVMDFGYKLLNYLIQGSAADITKEAICRYDAHPKREGRLVVTVYDEVDISIPKRAVKREMTLLRDCMRSVETTIPMLSDGEIGMSWGNLEKYAI